MGMLRRAFARAPRPVRAQAWRILRHRALALEGRVHDDIARGRFQRARRRLERAQPWTGGSTRLFWRVASSALAAGDHVEAVACLRILEAEESLPDKVPKALFRALYLDAQALESAGELGGAVERYREAWRIAADDVEGGASEKLRIRFARALERRAAEEASDGRLDQAVGLLDEARDLLPADLSMHEAFWRTVEARAAAGDVDAAIVAARREVARRPHLAGNRVRAAKLLRSQGLALTPHDPWTALEHYREARAVDDDRATAQSEIVGLLRAGVRAALAEHTPREAAALLQELWLEDPENPTASHLIAQTLPLLLQEASEMRAAGDRAATLPVLRLAATLEDADPADTEGSASLLLAGALREQAAELLEEGDIEGAAATLAEGLKVWPDDLPSLPLVSKLLDAVDSGRAPEETATALRELAKRSPQLSKDRGQLLELRGDALVAREMFDSAARAYREARALGNDDATIRDRHLNALRQASDDFLEKGDLAKACANLEDAVELRNDPATVHRLGTLVRRRVRAAIDEGRLSEATELALQHAGDDHEIDRMLEDIRRDALQAPAGDEALALLRKLAQGGDARAGRRLADLLEHQATKFERSRDPVAALSSLREAHALARTCGRVEQDRRLRERLASLLCSVARATAGGAMVTTDSRVGDLLREALELAPDQAPVRVVLDQVVTVAVKGGLHEHALETLSCARPPGQPDRDIDAKIAWVHQHRGAQRMRAGDFAGATEDLRRSLRDVAAPEERSGVTLALGRALTRLAGEQVSREELDLAAVSLDEARALVPDEKIFHQALLRLVGATARGGHLEAALALLQPAREMAPEDEVLAARAAALLHQQAFAIERLGDVNRAISVHREAIDIERAIGLAPNPKLARQTAQTFRRAAGTRFVAGDVDEGETFLREGLEIDTSYEEARTLLDHVARLPREPVRHYLPSGSRGAQEGLADLVIIEDGVDRELLGQYLSLFDVAEFYSEHRLLQGYERGKGRFAVDCILDSGTVGLDQDVRICHSTDVIAGEVRAVVREALPHRMRTFEGFGAVDLASWEFDDVIFNAGRKLEVFSELIGCGRFGRVVFVLGDNRLTTLRGTAAKTVGADHVYFTWCSALHARYDDRLWPLAEYQGRASDVEPTTIVRRPVWHRAPEERNVRASRIRRLIPRRQHIGRAGGRGRLAVFTNRGAQHVENTKRILRELSPELPVTFLIPPTERADHYDVYSDLVAADPKRYQFHYLAAYLERGGAGLDEEVRSKLEQAVEGVAADPRTRGLKLADKAFWAVLEPAILRLIGERLLRAQAFAMGFSAYLEHARPLALLVSPDRRTESRIACALTRRAGPPSLFAQIALVAESPRLKPPQADVITVIDEFTSSLFQDVHGTRPERILITGIPRFDGILERRERAAAGEHSNAATGKRVLLVLQRFSPEYTEKMIRLAAEALLPHREVALMVRMHPSEATTLRERYRRFLEGFGAGERYSIDDDDLYEVISSVDLLIGAFSNVLMEAAMLERLVLSVNLTGTPFPLPFVEQGLAFGAETEPEVRERIVKALYDQDFIAHARARQKGWLERNPHLIEGRAAPRIARALESMAGMAQNGTAPEC